MPLALSAAQKSSLLYQGLGLRFNADGPRGLIARKEWNGDNRPSSMIYNVKSLQRLLMTVPFRRFTVWYAGGSRTWTFGYLKTFHISLHESTVSRELKALGFSKINAVSVASLNCVNAGVKTHHWPE